MTPVTRGTLGGFIAGSGAIYLVVSLHVLHPGSPVSGALLVVGGILVTWSAFLFGGKTGKRAGRRSRAR